MYVFAAGNGGDDDNCNADGFITNPYTIAVGALRENTSRASYSEKCPSVFVAAYGGDEQRLIVGY